MHEAGGPVPAFTDAVQARDPNRMIALLARDVTLSVPPLHLTRSGADEVMAALGAVLDAFGELRYEVRSRYIGTGTVTDEAVLVGRQTLPFLGAQPGRRVSSVAIRVIIAHDLATVTGITVWPDLSAVRQAMSGASRTIDLTGTAQAGSVVTDLRATIPPGHAKVIMSSPRDTEVSSTLLSPQALWAGRPATGGSEPVGGGRPATGRDAPRPPVPKRVRRRRAITAGTSMLAASAAIAAWIAAGALNAPVGATATSPSAPTSSRSIAAPGAGAGPSRGTPGPSGAPTATRSPTSAPRPVEIIDDKATLGADQLFFDTDSAELSEEAQGIIDGLIIAARRQHRRGKVVVTGYTDDRGGRTHNLTLSRKRAAAVAEVLTERLAGTGMQFVPSGRGATDFVASNRTSSGRRMNRRVVVDFAPTRTSAARGRSTRDQGARLTAAG